MKKYDRYFLYFISVSYILLTIIEFIKYLLFSSNVFGLIYMIACALIIFLLVPTTLNYKDNISAASTSKLIIIIILSLFSSFLLDNIIVSSVKYVDSLKEYIYSIRIIKNILKPSLILLIFCFIIYKKDVFKKIIKKAKNIEK